MSSSDDARFDASQYHFFGKDIMEEVELGGLEDQENDKIATALPGYEFTFSTEDKGLADAYASVAHVDDLSSTFAKLNRAVSDPIRPRGSNVDRNSISRESSSTLDWFQETDYWSWSDFSQTKPGRCDSDTMIWQSKLPSSHHLFEAKTLLRTSSSPQEPPSHQHHHNNPSLLLDPNILTRAASQSRESLNLTRHSSIPSLSCSHPTLPTLPSPPYGNLDFPSFARNLSFISQEQNLNVPYLLNRHIQNQNSRNSPVLDLPYQFNIHSVVEPKGPPSWCKQKDIPQTSGTSVSSFRPKYMTLEELQNLSRMIDSRSHGDQYVKDYYHQACLSKRGVQTQFYPSSVRSIDTTTHKSFQLKEMEAILSCGSAVGGANIKRPSYNRPLEKEPMFAARVLVDDGFHVLLDVDDINRVLQHTVQQNNIAELKKHRQILLECLAASLQLFDPLGSYVASNPLNDDLVFLSIVALPKGRELVTRYLQLIPPGAELARVVCMAIFRHLRVLFGVMPAEKAAAEKASKLAKTVLRCVQSFEVNSLSACLAAVVCSSEQPPLRPLGSSAGDGASVALKVVLERASNLLFSNPIAPTRYFMPALNFWQASFDAFFNLLLNYCIGKSESILQQLFEPTAAEMVKAIGREMPVELLHAILPHTNESQRKMLFNFLRRYMPGLSTSTESFLD